MESQNNLSSEERMQVNQTAGAAEKNDSAAQPQEVVSAPR